MAASDELTPLQKDAIQLRLVKLFGSERALDFARVANYLDNLEKDYNKAKTDYSFPIMSYPRIWRTLHLTLEHGESFNAYAETLCEDTKKAENDAEFREKMKKIYEDMVCAGSIVPKEGFDKSPLIKGVLSTALGLFTPLADDILICLVKILPKIANPSVVSALDDVVGLVAGYAPLATVLISAAYLTYEAVTAIRDWLNGKITGKRAAKRVVDALGGTVGGVAGGAGGMALGAIGGPFGIIIGGILGSVGCSFLAGTVTDHLTRRVFNVPKDEALEMAYNALGVDKSATNDQINRAWRQKCLETHSDKGGSDEKFIEIQAHMTVIKQCREKGDDSMAGMVQRFKNTLKTGGGLRSQNTETESSVMKQITAG